MSERIQTSRPEPAQQPGTRSAEGEVTIDATPERVWHALTDARELERWFPLDAHVEPGEGGSIRMSWRNEFAGDMEILVWDPPHHLRTSWSFGEGAAPAQITDYIIEAKGGSTVMRAVTSGFPLDASWDGWVEGTKRGWAFELRSLQHYLEHHEGEARHVIYLRRRVPQSPEQVWARLRASSFGPWLEAGEAFDDRPGSQYAAILDDPADAMLRISVESGGPGADQREVVVFMSVWGDRGERVAALERAWARELVAVFEDGVTP